MNREEIIKEILEVRAELSVGMFYPEEVPDYILKGNKDYVTKLDDTSLEAEYLYCMSIKQETISEMTSFKNNLDNNLRINKWKSYIMKKED